MSEPTEGEMLEYLKISIANGIFLDTPDRQNRKLNAIYYRIEQGKPKRMVNSKFIAELVNRILTISIKEYSIPALKVIITAEIVDEFRKIGVEVSDEQ